MAIKKLYNSSYKTEFEVVGSIFTESNEYVTCVIDLFQDQSHTYIVLPYIARAQELSDVMNRSSFTSNDAKVYMEQILAGVAYLHDCGISHGDLHGGNILVKNHG